MASGPSSSASRRDAQATSATPCPESLNPAHLPPPDNNTSPSRCSRADERALVPHLPAPAWTSRPPSTPWSGVARRASASRSACSGPATPRRTRRSWSRSSTRTSRTTIPGRTRCGCRRAASYPTRNRASPRSASPPDAASGDSNPHSAASSACPSRSPSRGRRRGRLRLRHRPARRGVDHAVRRHRRRVPPRRARAAPHARGARRAGHRAHAHPRPGCRRSTWRRSRRPRYTTTGWSRGSPSTSRRRDGVRRGPGVRPRRRRGGAPRATSPAPPCRGAARSCGGGRRGGRDDGGADRCAPRPHRRGDRDGRAARDEPDGLRRDGPHRPRRGRLGAPGTAAALAALETQR